MYSEDEAEGRVPPYDNREEYNACGKKTDHTERARVFHVG